MNDLMEFFIFISVQTTIYFRRPSCIAMRTVLSVALAAMLGISAVQGDSFIEWKPGDKLTWDDFRQRPDPASPNAALTSSLIKYDYSYSTGGGLAFHIYCQFDRNKSWGRTRTDYVLSHEQGHFDIAEVYARRLNKAFSEYTAGSNFKKDINKIYMDHMHALTDEQNLYDRETGNSTNHDQQEKWLKKISDELKEMEKYANYH